MFYRITRAFLRLLFKLLYRLESVGAEKLVPGQGYILCPNHVSNLDPPLVGTPLSAQVHFMAKVELFDIPVLGRMIRSYGAYPVNRDSMSRQTLVTTMQLLRDGNLVCIFPEGSRNSQEARKGAATFADKAKVPVIPVAIVGSYRPFSKMKIVYGNPLTFDEFAGLDRDERIDKATEQIMVSIHHLMKQYHKK